VTKLVFFLWYQLLVIGLKILKYRCFYYLAKFSILFLLQLYSIHGGSQKLLLISKQKNLFVFNMNLSGPLCIKIERKKHEMKIKPIIHQSGMNAYLFL